MRMVVRRHALRLREPLQTSYGTLEERELLVVALTDEDGITGYGEAAPLEPYDGVSIARVEQALERYRPVVEGAAGMNGAGGVAAVSSGILGSPAAAGPQLPVKPTRPRRR